MENEVDPRVFTEVERLRLSQPPRSVTEVIERMGVPEAWRHRFDYAWRLTGGVLLVTIWAEFVQVHSNGRWFYVEPLDTRTRLGGGARTDDQRKRAEFRVDSLHRIQAKGQTCLAVLQTNKVPIAQLEQNENAKVGIRVKDNEQWHVARWDAARGRAILVRGPAGWVPTDAEVDEHLERRPMDGSFATPPMQPPALPTPPPAPPAPDPKIGFPNQAHRDAVEAAAMKHMVAFYEAQKLVVHDVSKDNLGYDLRVEDVDGMPAYLVEVKGTSMLAEGFFISRNERRCSEREPAWLLAVVINALAAPTERIFNVAEMEQLFSFEPLVWRCDTK
ncbi:MAG: DUF3883 domain-containing protein [Polaromonas sp.]|uniref:DUF3883 domain-containing protein n=1 Tax=Polaromonas sp. TaxID=1869339 RepID=UPI0027332D46|nr:DUF3883 domain-containing protein [Polaromonas sp.]MDP3799800.1 DUF3883 domain-containing protein [Polaromonas sp.]